MFADTSRRVTVSFAIRFSIALTAVLAHDPAEAAGPAPNVMVILADDLGYSDLGCYGSRIETPNLDRLAAGGMRFTKFYNTARCWPTRAALLTGYYAQQVKFDTLPDLERHRRGPRPRWAGLIPERLRSVGYRSYHTGKWHLDGMPLGEGFDGSYYLKDQSRFFSPKIHYRNDVQLPEVSRDEGFYGTTEIGEQAVRLLKEHAAQHAERPFFHFLAFTSPHFPLHALPEDIRKYEGVFASGWNESRKRRYHALTEQGLIDGKLSPVEPDVGPPYPRPQDVKDFGPGELDRPLPWDTLTPVQQAFQARKMAIHAAMVDHMDQQIGRVIEQLETMDAMDNTLIMFLSDNGASAEIMIRGDGHDVDAPMGSADTYLCLGPGWSSAANTPYRRHKTWVHEGGNHTPFIAHWPRGITAEVRQQTRGLNHSLCHVIDIAPTILELAGKEVPVATQDGQPPMPGRSFASALKGKELPPRSLWWFHEGNRAYRQGDWKVVAAKGEPWELYDLSRDPTETNNLAEQYPDKLGELTEAWTREAKAMARLRDEG